MRKLFTLFVLALSAINIYAQAPSAFNYQAVARNSTGSVLATQNISVRISIIDATPTGAVQYSETHTVATNQFGLFSIIIGGGTLASGSFTTITWSTGIKFLKVEVDPTGGLNYIDMGTSKLQSVPYALYSSFAKDATAEITGGVTNTVPKYTGVNSIGTSAITENGTNTMINGKIDITNSTGAIMFNDSQANLTFPAVTGGPQKPMINMFASGFNNADRMVLGHSPTYPTWGLMYSDVGDLWHFVAGGTKGITFDPSSPAIGIGNSSPTGVLDINTTNKLNNVFRMHNPNIANNDIFGMEFGKDNTGNNMAEFRYNHVSDNSANNFINMGLWGNTNTLIVQGSGNVGIGNTNPAARLDVNGTTKTTGFMMPTGAGAGKVLTSDGSGNGSWAALSGKLAQVVNATGNGAAITTAYAFVSATPTVTITAGQKVLVIASKAFGSTAAGGANGLNLDIGYKLSSAATPSNCGGGAILGMAVTQNTKNIYSMQYMITGLAAGTYTFGMLGLAATPANWNFNEYSYVTVMVFD